MSLAIPTLGTRSRLLYLAHYVDFSTQAKHAGSGMVLSSAQNFRVMSPVNGSGSLQCNVSKHAVHIVNDVMDSVPGDLAAIITFSGPRKSARLARFYNALMMDQAKLHKAHLRERALVENQTPTLKIPSRSTSSAKHSGPRAALYNKIKKKGTKCGISLDNKEVLCFKAFLSASS